jgi:ribosomal protein L44E
MANFKQKFETLEASKSPKVKLDLGTAEKTDKDEWVGGLKKLYLHNKEGKKKAIGIFRCTKCKKEVASYEGEGHSRICNCGGTFKLVDVIDQEIVSEITSREVGYQCPKCGRVYHQPVQCCVPAKSLNVGEIRSF